MLKPYLASILLCVLLNSCSYGCLELYQTFPLTVTDASGTPVLLDSITVTNLETGRAYPKCDAEESNFPCLNLSPAEDDPSYPSYEIMNDSFNDTLKRSGTRILVEGAKEELSFSREYVFRSGTCGVRYEGGLLEITLE